MKHINFFVILLILWLCVINSPNEEYTTKDYIVKPGDTAWQIAIESNTANKDVRKIIYYIGKDNNIKPGYIYPGQKIKIRVYKER